MICEAAMSSSSSSSLPIKTGFSLDVEDFYNKGRNVKESATLSLSQALEPPCGDNCELKLDLSDSGSAFGNCSMAIATKISNNIEIHLKARRHLRDEVRRRYYLPIKWLLSFVAAPLLSMGGRVRIGVAGATDCMSRRDSTFNL